MNTLNFLEDSINILKESTSSVFERHEIAAILEDVNSPVQMKYNQKIYDAVLQKKHIDFDDIPRSRGDINAYSGTRSMKETLKVIKGMNEFQKTNVIDYVATIEEAISNIENLRDVYKQGFDTKCDYVMLEYNIFVYTCVEATTSILYQFVDYIKKPGSDSYQIVLKNTKYRANLVYIQQLEKFNNINKNMLGEYRKFLLSMINGNMGKDNFSPDPFTMGVITVAFVAASILPMTRELIYQFYNLKRKLSDCLAEQAYFLEMNKAVVEANTEFTVDKKKKILAKQEAIKKKLIVLSEALRVDRVKADEATKRQLNAENRNISVRNIRKEIDDSPLELL
jgi:hypothetical protein